MLSDDQLIHTATVEAYQGSGSVGDSYAAAVEVPCYYEGRRELVRDSSGEEAVSEGRLFTNDDIPVDSRITVAGRTTHVLSVATLDDGGGLAHFEVSVA